MSLDLDQLEANNKAAMEQCIAMTDLIIANNKAATEQWIAMSDLISANSNLIDELRQARDTIAECRQLRAVESALDVLTQEGQRLIVTRNSARVRIEWTSRAIDGDTPIDALLELARQVRE